MAREIIDDEISVNTLKMMDNSIQNLAKGLAGDPVELLNEDD